MTAAHLHPVCSIAHCTVLLGVVARGVLACLLYISTSVRGLRPQTQVEINGKRRKTLKFH